MDSEVSSEGEPGIFAFFSIGISHMDIRPEVPGRYRRKLNVILKKPTVPCYVLGQLGKNEPYKNAITGKEIIDYAMQFLIDAHKIVGGCKGRNGQRQNDLVPLGANTFQSGVARG